MGESWEWTKAKKIMEGVGQDNDPSEKELRHMICLLEMIDYEREERRFSEEDPQKG